MEHPVLIIIALEIIGILYFKWQVYKMDKLNDCDFKPWNEADYQAWLKNHKKKKMKKSNHKDLLKRFKTFFDFLRQ